jgi:nuclear pore complex protein Nup93
MPKSFVVLASQLFYLDGNCLEFLQYFACLLKRAGCASKLAAGKGSGVQSKIFKRSCSVNSGKTAARFAKLDLRFPESRVHPLFATATFFFTTTSLRVAVQHLLTTVRPRAIKMSLFGSLNKPPATSGSTLFGSGSGPASQPAQTGGLFSSLGSSSAQPQQTTGLFGATTQPQQQQGTTTGLFGSLAGSTQPQQQQSATTGLFGSLGPSTQPQQQQGATTGLFGASTQGQQPQTSSLFGGLGTTTQTQQTQGTSLAGGIGQQAGGSLLGGGLGQSQQRNDQQSAETTNYFNSILEKSRKRAVGETPDEDLPQLQLGLGDLRQRIKRLNQGTKDKTADGRAHYLLAASGVDPGAAVRDLNAFSATAGRTERSQTYEAPPVDVESYLLNLQTQTTLNMISDGLARSVRDFDAFLEANVNMEWDAQRSRIYQHFGIKQKTTEDTSNTGGSFTDSQGGFGRSRRSKAPGLPRLQASTNTKSSTFGRSTLHKSVIGAAGPIGAAFQPVFSDVEKRIESNNIDPPGPDSTSHREKQSRYAEKVASLNAARLQKQCIPLLHDFSSVAEQSREDHSRTLAQAYGALIEIVKEEPEIKAHSDPLAITERKFAISYLDEDQNSDKAIEVNRRILRGSTRYLEDLFYTELEVYIAKSAKDALLGGRPGVIKKVQAYVRLKASRRDLAPDHVMSNLEKETGKDGEEYLWPVVFYLLRTGHVQEAVNYVEQKIAVFRSLDRNFEQYLTSYSQSHDRRLERHLQERINSEYHQRRNINHENNIDPFKMACYKVIGRCDLRNRTLNDSMAPTIEDYMWLQLALAREVKTSGEIASEVCNLATVRSVIKDLGTRFFSTGENYGAYVLILILGGYFEEAVSYLYPFAYADAVHMAIALDYYGLLRVSDPTMEDSQLLSYTTKDFPQLKFGHMVGLYTRDFRAANANAAVDYLTLICLNKDLPDGLGQRQVSLCHEALRELVLESREFANLLGDIRSDGQRIKGVIEKRMKLIALDEQDDFMRIITIQAASIADDNGRTTDAALLYHLAGEYDNVITIINRAMSESLALQIGQEPMRLQPLKPRAAIQANSDELSSLSLTSVDDPVELAQNMLSLYKRSKTYTQRISETSMADCEVLIKIREAREYVQQEQWSLALDVSLHFIHGVIRTNYRTRSLQRAKFCLSM